MIRNLFYSAGLVLMFFLPACGAPLVHEKSEAAMLSQVSDFNRGTYEEYLVDEKRYSAGGNQYHRKFKKHLLAIVSDLVGYKKLSLQKGSVGFYYDRKAGNPNRLYLGLDVNSGLNLKEGFTQSDLSTLRKQLRDVIKTILACQSVIDERGIAGVVVGWKWRSGAREGQFNIWMKKGDLARFEKNQLTFEELIQRSEVYNTAGKVILLPI